MRNWLKIGALLAGLVSLAPVAMADQAPETLVVTGPTFQQIPTSNLSVSVNGTVESLGHALATGGGGTPGGSNGNIQYNNAGSFGGLATTGSGNAVLATSPTLVTPNLGTPSALTLTNATGLPVSGLSGLGTGVAASLGQAVTGSGGSVLATSPTLVTPNLGTPSALTLTNATGLPVSGLTGLGTGVAASLGVAVTGSGGSVLASSPTIATPTLTGTTTAGAINSSGSINSTNNIAAFQINGTTVMGNLTGLNGFFALGPGAGAAQLASGTPNGLSMFMGYHAGALWNSNGISAESTCAGADCLSENTGATSTRLTCFGDGCMGWEQSGNHDFCGGGDCMRDTTGLVGDVAVGDFTMVNYFGLYSQTLGYYSLAGNSGQITFAGTPTAADVMSVTVTNDLLPGGVFTYNYTVPASPTLAGVTQAIYNGMSATLNSSGPANIVMFYSGSISPDTIAFGHQGTATVGDVMTITYSCTGTCAVTDTITGGVTQGNQSITAIGYQSVLGYQLSTGRDIFAAGQNVLANLTTGQYDNCTGDFSCQNITTDNQTNVYGGNALTLMSGGVANNVYGYNCGHATAKANDLIIFGDCQFSGSVNITGNNNVQFGYNSEVPDPTASNQLSIMNEIYGTNITGN